MRAYRRRVRHSLASVPALVAVLLMAACSAHPPEVAGTVAFIPGYQGGEAAAPAPVEGYPSPIPVVTATLADTSPTKMSIELSQPYAPAGKVSFLITNAGTMDHEMVVLKTDQPAGSFTPHGVRRGAEPVQRRRQGPHERGRDRGSGDEARHHEDAHDRHGHRATTRSCAT